MSREHELAAELVGALKARRQLRRMTQAALARRLGRAQSRVSEVEDLEVDPRLSTLLGMADSLGLKVMLVPNERAQEVSAVLGRMQSQSRLVQPTTAFDETFIPDPSPDDYPDDDKDVQEDRNHGPRK